MKIGWIGLGNMGIPMSKNILKAGYQLYVNNRTKEKATELIDLGATFIDHPKDLVKEVDIVFTIVSDDEAVKTLYKASDGVIAGLDKGKIVVDMSTISPKTSQEIAELCKEKGATMLDAPVSGSVKPAEEGQLVVLVGGDKEAYETCKPLFDVLGKASFHLGDNGAGSKAKLAINSLLGITIQGIAETVLFAEANGISRATMLDIINLSAVQSPISKLKTPNIIEDRYPAAFALKHGRKDLNLAVDEAKKISHSFPLIEKAASSFNEAFSNGKGEEDIMAIISYLLNNHK